MTRADYERNKERLARQSVLHLVADAQRNCDPAYAIGAAGYWLSHWHRDRSVQLGQRKCRKAA